MMGYHDMGWSDGGWWILMWSMMGLFWAFLIIGVVWLVNAVRRDNYRDGESPEDILARRLASGEIDESMYRKLRDTIGSRRGPFTPAG